MADDEDDDLYDEEFDFVDEDEDEAEGDDGEVAEDAAIDEDRGEDARDYGHEDAGGDEAEEPLDEYGRPETPPANDVFAWLQPDLRAPRPEVAQLLGALFSALDREGKGTLSVDELAWAHMLQPGVRNFAQAQLEAVKERYALPLERIFADVTSASAGGVR